MQNKYKNYIYNKLLTRIYEYIHLPTTIKTSKICAQVLIQTNLNIQTAAPPKAHGWFEHSPVPC